MKSNKKKKEKSYKSDIKKSNAIRSSFIVFPFGMVKENFYSKIHITNHNCKVKETVKVNKVTNLIPSRTGLPVSLSCVTKSVFTDNQSPSFNYQFNFQCRAKTSKCNA